MELLGKFQLEVEGVVRQRETAREHAPVLAVVTEWARGSGAYTVLGMDLGLLRLQPRVWECVWGLQRSPAKLDANSEKGRETVR